MQARASDFISRPYPEGLEGHICQRLEGHWIPQTFLRRIIPELQEGGSVWHGIVWKVSIGAKLNVIFI